MSASKPVTCSPGSRSVAFVGNVPVFTNCSKGNSASAKCEAPSVSESPCNESTRDAHSTGARAKKLATNHRIRTEYSDGDLNCER